MTEGRGVQQHSPEEYLSQVRGELKNEMLKAGRGLKDGSFYDDLRLYLAMNTFQDNLGRKIDISRTECVDFGEFYRGYGKKQGARIIDVNPEEFWREEFNFFPNQELVQEGILPSERGLAISLYPNTIVVTADKYYVRVGYRTENFSLELVANGKRIIDLLETKKPLERALAISELLLAVDKAIDQKLQTAVPANP